MSATDEKLDGIKDELVKINEALSGSGTLNFSSSTGFLISDSKDSMGEVKDAVASIASGAKKRDEKLLKALPRQSKKSDIHKSKKRDEKGKFVKNEQDKVKDQKEAGFLGKLLGVIKKDKIAEAGNIAEGFGDVYYQSAKELSSIVKPFGGVFSYLKKFKKKPEAEPLSKAVRKRDDREEKKRIKLDKNRNRILKGILRKNGLFGAIMGLLKNPLALIATGIGTLIGVVSAFSGKLTGLLRSFLPDMGGPDLDIDTPDKSKARKTKKPSKLGKFFSKAKGFGGKALSLGKKAVPLGFLLPTAMGVGEGEQTRSSSEDEADIMGKISPKMQAISSQKSGAIERNRLGDSKVKDWKQLESLSAFRLKALIDYDDWSDEDLGKMKLMHSKKTRPALVGAKKNSLLPTPKGVKPSSLDVGRIASDSEASAELINSKAKQKAMSELFGKPPVRSDKGETVIAKQDNRDVVKAINDMNKNIKKTIEDNAKESTSTVIFEPTSLSTKEAL